MTTVHEGQKKAFIGWEEEGLTVELWLNRLGLHHVYAPLMKTIGKDRVATFNLERLKQLDEKGLECLGVTAEGDRRIILQMKDTNDKQARIAFRFINYYATPSDPRTLKQCISDGRATIFDLLIKVNCQADFFATFKKSISMILFYYIISNSCSTS